MPPQGYCTYPGVVSVLSARYTLAHGITPGVVELEIAPQSGGVAPIGNVVFYYGTTTLTLLDCKPDAASTVAGSDGTITSLRIYDRRWRWRFGEIYGHYNQRDSDGNVISDTEKTPRQLAQILLSAMGESADTSAIPNEAREEVEWVGENPAEELQSLLEKFGCTLVLRPDQAIAIHQVGVGAALPVNEYLAEAQAEGNPPDVPATVRVVGAPVRYQARLELEPVAQDTDGSYRHIDQLSYKPQVSAGWGGETDFFSGVTNENARALAMRDVFKLYRIRDQNSASPANVCNVPGAGVITKRRQILPLQFGLVETGADPDGQKRRKPERVMGIYFIRNSGQPQNSTTSTNYEYRGAAQIDYERGLVRFSEPVVKYDSTNDLWQPAELKLECSFTVQSLSLGSLYRYTYTLPTGFAVGSGVDVVRREEILQELYESYSSNASPAVWQEKTPQATLDAQGLYYARGRVYSYVSSDTSTGRYVGLQPAFPDGAIQQITWEVTAAGTFTTVSRNGETHPYLPPYKARRVQEGNRKARWKALQNERGRK